MRYFGKAWFYAQLSSGKEDLVSVGTSQAGAKAVGVAAKGRQPHNSHHYLTTKSGRNVGLPTRAVLSLNCFNFMYSLIDICMYSVLSLWMD